METLGAREVQIDGETRYVGVAGSYYTQPCSTFEEAERLARECRDEFFELKNSFMKRLKVITEGYLDERQLLEQEHLARLRKFQEEHQAPSLPDASDRS